MSLLPFSLFMDATYPGNILTCIPIPHKYIPLFDGWMPAIQTNHLMQDPDRFALFHSDRNLVFGRDSE